VLLGSEFWFAVQVISRAEQRVAALIDLRGYETFVPTYKAVRKWSDRKKHLDLPLFPGYVFCRLTHTVSGLLLSTPGVLRIVSFGGKPSPIANSEIEQVQRAVASGAKTMPWSYLCVGQKVRVESGPLAGVHGILVQVRAQRRLVISVSTITKSISVDVDAAEVIPVPVACAS
jgi:transcription antitermination factor NusG